MVHARMYTYKYEEVLIKIRTLVTGWMNMEKKGKEFSLQILLVGKSQLSHLLAMFSERITKLI